MAKHTGGIMSEYFTAEHSYIGLHFCFWIFLTYKFSHVRDLLISSTYSMDQQFATTREENNSNFGGMGRHLETVREENGLNLQELYRSIKELDA
jgi:hypothetical protein